MIVTFYSFKGGVGRSMALANIGAWLYGRGRRVLLVDWDLEAPGLESFFSKDAEQLNSIRASPGLIDLVENYRQLWRNPSPSKGEEISMTDKATSLTKRIGSIRHLFHPLADTSEDAIETPALPGIWLLHAGCRAGVSEEFYNQSVQSLDWRGFYEEYGGYPFMEWLRGELDRDVDFVLIDSRTGVTEMGGVCTQHLADVVILMFAPNNANLEGATRIAKLLVGEKVKELRGSARPLDVFPIPSRVDTQGATEYLEDFEKRFKKAFDNLSVVDLSWSWESKVRYIASYSYQESVLFLNSGGHKDLKLAYERIGGQILRMQDEKLSPSDRKSQASSRHMTRQGKEERGTDRSRVTIQQLMGAAAIQIDSGDFVIASSLLRSAFDLAEKELGSEHPDTLSAMNNLASSLYALHDYEEARALQERVLAARARLTGEESLDTLTSLGNLAETLQAQGDLASALPLLERSLSIRERLLGPEHPETLVAVDKLAALLQAQRSFERARALFERSLENREKILGPEHPDFAKALNNLASLFTAQGDLTSAKLLLDRARAVRPGASEAVVAENWTALAPKPAALAQGKAWHVFISYRSLSRAWALALYDILNGLGYKIFLDQYVLTAAAPLALSLGEALDASQSAILVWSGKYEDSEWCKKEFSRLETMENAKTGFHYVIARVDESQISGFAATKLWVDFSQQPEGPGGSGLLKMLYGLQGKPLPPEAVKLGTMVDKQMEDDLTSVYASRDIGDWEGLVSLAATSNMAWTGSPMLLCAAAEGLIAMKKTPEALKVLDSAETAFPEALRPKQLRGLAYARHGDTMKAQLVLSKLYAAGQIGPEALGILARTWMDRYIQTRDRTFLLKSRDLYRQAFDAFPSDYYTGINAASKSLFLGEKETAAQLAKRVQEVVGDKAAPADYWKTATVAEVQLLQGNYDAATNLYQAAVLIAPLEYGSHESSYNQAKLVLEALDAPADQKAKIAAVFQHIAPAVPVA